MKATDNFKKTIQSHIDSVASKDSSFAEKVKNPKKNIDNCITYILNQVQKSKCNGFADSEIFGMALHYYDEENVKPGKKVNMRVVVNHQAEKTQKPAKRKKEPKTDDQPTLFDL